MSSSESSVEMAKAKAKAKETKEKVVMAADDYVKRQQRLPPIRPPRISESLFQAFPKLRDGEAAIRSLIKEEERVLRQYQKVLVYAEDDDGHRQGPPPGR